MAKVTRTLTVNDAGAPEELHPSIPCKKITIYEDPTAAGWPRKWQWRCPLSTSSPAVIAEGGSKIFEPLSDNVFQQNELVAFVELLAAGGSTSFIVIEEM